MKVIKTQLEGVIILEWEEKRDIRGPKYTNFSRREYAENGIDFNCVEELVYGPMKGNTLYGIHFQNHPKPQAKLLYCIEGSGMDYAVDLRKDSPDYLKWVAVELSESNHRQLLIPKGFGHAFVSLKDSTRVVMQIDEYFDPKYSRQIAWNDESIGIDFPTNQPILAPHDEMAPKMKDSDINL